MSYFTTREVRLLPSFTIDVKEKEKLDYFLTILDRSNVAKILNRVKEDNTKNGGRPSFNKYYLFATILYAFAYSKGSVREIEENCRYDLRYIYLMNEYRPSYVTISRFINDYIVPYHDEIFHLITKTILEELNVDIDETFIDGTKLEARPNRYKFVYKPIKFHKRLCKNVRELLKKLNLDNDLPFTEIFSSAIIADKLSAFANILDKENKDMMNEYLKFEGYLYKSLEYESKEAICGPDRNSYYKTDHDATAMTLKNDYYSGLGSSTRAAYNFQIIVSKGLAISYYLSQSRTDIKDFIPAYEKLHSYYDTYPTRICADAGYGSKYNYRYLKEHDIENYVKHQSFAGNISGRNPDRYHLDKDKNLICLNGNKGHIIESGNRHPKIAGSVFYRVDGCNSCPFVVYCKSYQKIKDEDFKVFEVDIDLAIAKREAEDNLLSIKGIELRVNRSVQVEGVFGSLKYNMGYDRFRRTSTIKVETELMLKIMGHNVRKLMRYYDGDLDLQYWHAPDNIEPERRKKPSAKRLTNRVNRKKHKSPNQLSKESYRGNYKKRGVKT